MTAPTPKPPPATVLSLAKVDPQAARAVLERWLAAQNQGDFEAYQACYAARVEGIKRIGPRIASFDRAGWLADRKRMFKKKMMVEMTDLEVSTTSTTARARFTQKWASGKYEDLGPKEILLVREGGQLRIAREEMLESKIARAPKGSWLSEQAFQFVVTLGDDTYVVLGDGNGIAHGKPELVEIETEGYAAQATVADQDLPAEVVSWRGREVVSEDCRARVVDFILFDRVVPHFGTVQQWRGESGDGERPATNEQIADDLFGSGEILIGGRLDASCGPYVRVADQPAWLDGEWVDDPALAKRAEAAFRKLPRYREIEAEAAEEAKEIEADPDRDEREILLQQLRGDPFSIETSIYRHPKNGQLWILVGGHNDGMCGEFEAVLWAVFRADAKGKKLSVVNAEFPLYSKSGAEAIDVDVDGELEWVIDIDFPSETSILIRSDGELLREVGIIYGDCPC